MIQVSKTHGKRAHITNEFVRETPALNTRNTIIHYIIIKVCSLRTLIGTFFLTCFLSNLYVIRIWIKNQDGSPQLQQALEKFASQVGFTGTCLCNNCQVPAQSIG